MTDLNRMNPKTAEEMAEAKAIIDDQYEYHTWTPEQVNAGGFVREALKTAAMIIVQCVPASADRSAALRKLREARMDANSAITHGGKY